MSKTIVTTCCALVLFATSAVSAQQCQSHQRTMTTAAPASHVQAEKDIVTTAVEAGSFKTLAAALTEAGLVEALQGEGPFTVFAPTDEAFAALPPGTVEELLKPENLEKLQAILKYHVVSGKIMAGDVLNAMEVETLQGSKAPIGLTIGGANIITTDINCSNGVIHVIDAVILPE
ncbi:MAG: fasciclin domain-containing protein [Pirellulaceae bacterium]